MSEAKKKILPEVIVFAGPNGSGKSTFLRLFHLQGVDYFRIEQGGIYFCSESFPNESIHKYSSHQLSRLNCFISYIGQEERFITSDSAYSYIYRVTKYALDEQDLSKEEKDLLSYITTKEKKQKTLSLRK